MNDYFDPIITLTPALQDSVESLETLAASAAKFSNSRSVASLAPRFGCSAWG
jgi:hypothetical protein